jgi:hypothetical protein
MQLMAGRTLSAAAHGAFRQLQAMTTPPPPTTPSERPPPDLDSNGTPEELAESADGQQLLFQYIPSWLTSFLLHVSVILLLALIPILAPRKETLNLTAGVAGPAVETPTEIVLDPLENLADTLDQPTAIEVDDPTLEPLTEAPKIENLSEAFSMNNIVNPADIGFDSSANPLSAPVSGNELAARKEAGRSEAARRAGATAASEECVALGLQWLAAHQLPDGSWNFNHQIGPGNRSSPNPGQYDDCPLGATGMCLMAFLGNGQTHLEGDYKEVVSKGLNYLVTNQRRINEFSGSMMDPNGQAGMYSHGLATIALAEAYSMTKDPGLRDPAQAAINFIAFFQDPTGGGWRYSPKQTGDLSVTGWILMALKSGLMADLEVHRNTSKRAVKFLDAVSFDSGARYGYRAGNKDPTANMTAVGLLCRMYMGWKREHPSLERGVGYLFRAGPAIGERTNMYFNYYAAQVLRQYGGDEWAKWNQEMRDFLVQTQSREGATKGSWFFDSGTDSGPAAGGRIYCTAMSVMTLEVYYRFLPIYRDAAVEEEFPLE